MKSLKKHRFSDKFYNGITYFGVLLSVCILFCEVMLFGIDFFAHNQNAYLGIITYVLLPPFLILGLVLIPFGAHLKMIRVAKGEALGHPKPLVIDLSLSSHQNAIIIFLIGTIIVMVMTVIGSIKAFHYTETTQFCGTLCHGIMKPEYTTHKQSPHAKVKCVECHVGSGAGWYVHYKMAGARMLFKTVDNTYSRPVPAPVENLRPAKETCQECHWPGKHFSAIQLKRTYFPDDPSKDPSYTIKLLMSVGSQGKGKEGIHAHMNFDNDIYYVADDAKRQKISWVKTRDKSGVEKVYTTKDSPYKSATPPEEKIRKMDCMDCHNRPSHHFESPETLINRALTEGAISTTIPKIKGKAMEVLGKEYKTQEEATLTIREVLNEYYSKKYKEFYDAHQMELNQAIEAIIDIFKNNFFPEMKARWDAYPDNIGHRISLGCFRCHDDEHKTIEGATISRDCNSCHLITQQGRGDVIEKSPDGLEFKHPDGDESWKTSNCSECHTGG